MQVKTFPICEVFGYPPENTSCEATAVRKDFRCPFLNKRCVKASRRLDYPFGVCSVRQIKDKRAVIICPIRLYGDDQAVIDEVGHQLCGEVVCYIKIPEVRAGRFSIDWVVACCDASGNLIDYHGIEVIAVDTTGSLDQYFDAYIKGSDWQDIEQRYGINWANVYKRTLPQLIAKGAFMAKIGKKLAVVIQAPLIEKIQERLAITSTSNSAANLFFFSWELAYNLKGQKYDLNLIQVIPTSAESLAKEYVKGLEIRTPKREEFEQALRRRLKGLKLV